MEKIKNYFSDWTLFEKCWLILSSIIIVILSLIWGDSPLALISSLAGIISVVLCAKGKIMNYAFGMIQALTYLYICFGAHLYGEVMYNTIMIPIIIIGIINWKKHMNSEETEVKARNLTVRGWVITILGSVLAIVVYMKILSAIGGEFTLFDSMSTVLSVIASLLMITRYSEQWLMWIFVNVVSVVMWVSVLVNGGGGDITIAVMWTAYLFNSVYGYINWRKMARSK